MRKVSREDILVGRRVGWRCGGVRRTGPRQWHTGRRDVRLRRIRLHHIGRHHGNQVRTLPWQGNSAGDRRYVGQRIACVIAGSRRRLRCCDGSASRRGIKAAICRRICRRIGPYGRAIGGRRHCRIAGRHGGGGCRLRRERRLGRDGRGSRWRERYRLRGRGCGSGVGDLRGGDGGRALRLGLIGCGTGRRISLCSVGSGVRRLQRRYPLECRYVGWADIGAYESRDGPQYHRHRYDHRAAARARRVENANRQDRGDRHRLFLSSRRPRRKIVRQGE